MTLREKIKTLLRSPIRASQFLAELVQGTANQTSLINDKLNTLIECQRASLALQHAHLEMIAELIKSSRAAELIKSARANAQLPDATAIHEPPAISLERPTQHHPLLFAEKTYNKIDRARHSCGLPVHQSGVRWCDAQATVPNIREHLRQG